MTDRAYTPPPWHPWCGCLGCRAAQRYGKQIARHLASLPKEAPDA